MSARHSTAGIKFGYAVETTAGTRPTAGYTYISELKSEKLAADKVNRQSDAIFDSYRKHKDESEIKYVEVEKDKENK